MRFTPSIFALVALAAPGASAQPARPAPAAPAPSVGATAHANEVRATMVDQRRRELGEIRVRETSVGLLIDVTLEGVPPGTHGFHVHEVGRCEPPFESAGDHLAPKDGNHGFLAPGGPHGGDLVNLEVPADGRMRQTLRAPELTLADLRDADGSAFILHAAADDYESQPAGGSGERIGCARIDPVVASAR